uniref:Uncharacterized protein n=1 Tax=Sinocyclocheilus anshuiensis TaxID=1608454 RepID=A0A671S0C2_9TELE
MGRRWTKDGTNWPSLFFCSPSSVLLLCICSGKLGPSGSTTMCFFSLVQPLSLAFRPLGSGRDLAALRSMAARLFSALGAFRRDFIFEHGKGFRVSDFKGLVCTLSIFDLMSWCMLFDGLIIAFECLWCVGELLNLDSTVTLAAALKSVFVLLESCKSDAKWLFWFGSFLLALRVINPSLLLSCLEDLSIARWVTGASVLGAGENICASEGTLDGLFVLFEGLGIDFTFMSCFCFCIC